VFFADFILGEIIFDRSSSNLPRDAGERSQRRLTYEEAVEEAGNDIIISTGKYLFDPLYRLK